jgi:predicted ABC-type transport system involved in lysophospholipase L1 biosynthesis ATPase subunit
MIPMKTAETAAPLLSAEALEKRYRLPHGTVEVLRGASLDVGRRECVAIVGRSGAGKSTLLHLLGGLDRPDRGDVRIEDRSLFALKSRERAAWRARRVGFVFQSYHLLPEMDVADNVLLPAMALGATDRSALRRRALSLLEQVGLAGRAAHTPLELSGGEQQRVALARALMNDPALILADEPTGNLDRATGTQVLDLLFGITRDRGHALVVVTHAPDVAARCDRVLALEDGRIVPR